MLNAPSLVTHCMQPDLIHLVLFCRRPAAGIGKQRLARSLGKETAAQAARLLLGAALEDLHDWPGPVVLAPASAADYEWATGLLDRPGQVLAQPPGNLGERLNGIDRSLRANGAQKILYIGSDSPGLDAPYYAAARQALQNADVVLGPAADGGVTLMGARAAWPDLSGLPWSTARLGTALAELCVLEGWTLATLDTRHDVDHETDLHQLASGLRQDERPARQALLQWWQATGAQRGAGT